MSLLPHLSYGPRSDLAGPGLADGTAGAGRPFTLTARDQWGNLRGVGGDSWLVSLGAGIDYNTVGTVTDNGDGSYAFLFTLNRAASYTLRASVRNTMAPPRSFVVRAGATNAFRSELTMIAGHATAGVEKRFQVLLLIIFNIIIFFK